MLAKLQENYGWLVLFLILTGIGLDYTTSLYSIETKVITIFEQNGNKNQLTTIDYPYVQKFLTYFARFIYSLAGSIFISLFITNRITEIQKNKQKEELKELQNSINQNVFESLFKTIIPEEIFYVIKSEIIESKVIRRDALWLLDFNEINGKIELRHTIQYTLENISLSEVVDPINAILDPSEDNISTLEKLFCKIDETVLSDYNYGDKEDEIKGIKKEENNGTTKFRFDIKIPPKKSAKITIEFKTIFKNNISDQYFSKYSLINAKLITNFPSNYTFELYSSMSTPLKCTQESINRKIYELNGAILPHQGFVFDLRKIIPKSLNVV
jgi:hypothetical protein